MKDKRSHRAIGKRLTSVTFRIMHDRQFGLFVTEKHNGLYLRNLTQQPKDHAALHIETYEIGGKKFVVELKITPLDYRHSGDHDG